MLFRRIPILAIVSFFILIECFCQKQNRVCFKRHCFTVEIAKTPQERQLGLMFRKQLSLNRGMLFVFPEEKLYAFWMKNTYLPLDIIWLNKNKEIVFIKEGAKPCLAETCALIEPTRSALYVLEINAGLVKETGMKIGDQLEFSYLSKN